MDTMTTIKSNNWERVCQAFRDGCKIVKKEKKKEDKKKISSGKKS